MKVAFRNADYVGGMGNVFIYSKNLSLIADDTAIGIGAVNPKKATVKWSEVEWVEVVDEQVRKSRAGKVALLGPAALLASKTQRAADVTVHTRAGRDVHYRVKGVGAFDVRAKLGPLLAAVGVGWREDAPPPAAPAAAGVSEELERLADLHARGILSAEEFASAKARTIGRD